MVGSNGGPTGGAEQIGPTNPVHFWPQGLTLPAPARRPATIG